MSNRKAQGMPMNVIIIAIIVLVVLIILIAFFAGGFSSVVGKVRDLFTGTTSGQSRDVVIQTCQNLCDTAKILPESSKKFSGYCKQSFVVDDDSNPSTPAKRMVCGSHASGQVSVDQSVLDADQKKSPKISLGGTLAIDCPEII